jgi:hypothetical protein
MDLKEMEWEGMDWINLAHNRCKWQTAVNTVMNIQALQMQAIS